MNKNFLDYLAEDKTIAEKDIAAAKQIENNLLTILQDIKKGFDLINLKLSSFNSPALKSKFRQSIRDGLEGREGFNITIASKKLREWTDKNDK